MSKGAGLFLILAGVGAAAYALPPGLLPGTGTSAEQRLADVVQIATNATSVAKPAAEAEGRPARFAAPQLARRDEPAGPEKAGKTMRINKAVVVAEAPTSETAQANAPSGSGKISIVPAPKPATATPNNAATIVPPAPVAVRRNTSNGTTEGQAALARDIQRELKRVGCLEGDVSSDWGPAAQKAMKAFTDRVNATLPIDRPDHILLTLVRGQAAVTCGKACPAGQSTNSEGRCLPTAVIAQAAKRPLTRSANVVAPAAGASDRDTKSASVPAPLIAPAPRIALVETPKPIDRRTALAPSVSSAPAVAAPRLAAAAPIVTPPAPAARPDRAIEGRMALSGPSQTPERATPDSASRISPPLPGALSSTGSLGFASPKVKSAAVAPDSAPSQLPDVAQPSRPQQEQRARPSAREEDRAANRRQQPSPVRVQASAPRQQAPQQRYEAPRPRFTPSIFTRLSRDGY